MIYTLFFSALRPEIDAHHMARYHRDAAELLERARRYHPGVLDLAKYQAVDGERLSIVRVTDLEALEAWRRDPVHAERQEVGRRDYYQRYRNVVCQVLRHNEWRRNEA